MKGSTDKGVLPGNKGRVPEFVKPCLAKLSASPPVGSNWVHEIKFDGYRMQARIDGKRVELRTRTGLDWTARFPSIANALQGLRVESAILDGEAAVLDERGVTNFTDRVENLKSGRRDRIVFFVFDLLFLNGLSTLPLALKDRKELLSKILKSGRNTNGVIRFSDHVQGESAGILAKASTMGIEGIVSKRLDAPYRSGRLGDWIKTKCINTDEFVIAGYLDSSAIKGAVGALVLGYYDAKVFVYAGRTGTGFKHEEARRLWKLMQPLRVASQPFARSPDRVQSRGVTWVRPTLVAQIDYGSSTRDGLLRHAAFKALREDKTAHDVSRPETLIV